MIRAAALSLALVAAALAAPAAAQQRSDLPVPRYVSLRSDEVNVRAGPGRQYPVEWVLRRRNLPVEILAEFELWRKIRDPQGAEGWVHHSMLSGRRRAVVTGQMRTLLRRPDPQSNPVARVEPGVIAELLECEGEWCRLDAGGFRGWLRRAELWGVYANETVR